MIDQAFSSEGCLDDWEGTTDIGSPFGDGIYRKKSVSVRAKKTKFPMQNLVSSWQKSILRAKPDGDGDRSLLAVERLFGVGRWEPSPISRTELDSAWTQLLGH